MIPANMQIDLLTKLNDLIFELQVAREQIYANDFDLEQLKIILSDHIKSTQTINGKVIMKQDNG